MNDIPVVADHVTVRMIGGEVFIMHLETLRTYALNETASFIWSCFDGVRTAAEIVGALMGEYDISEDECRSRVMELMDTLLSEGLITLVERDA